LQIWTQFCVTWIIIGNAYWLFETTKRIWRPFFPFQYEGRTIWVWKVYWSKVFERHVTLLFSPMLDLLMNIWHFKIIDYEVRINVNFSKMLGKMGGGLGSWKSKIWQAYMHISNLLPGEYLEKKQIFAPTLEVPPLVNLTNCKAWDKCYHTSKHT
jgi:hypothetical protein